MNTPHEKEPLSILTIIKKIQNHELSPRSLDKDVRKLCVETLYCEGYSKVHIAEILQCHPKTVHRDIEEIYVKNASVSNEYFRKKCIGRLETATTNHCNHLMRLARDKTASVMERAQAEYLAYKALSETIKIYETLGLLNDKASVIEVRKSEDKPDQIDETDGYVGDREPTPEERQRMIDHISIILRHRILPMEEILPNYTVIPKDPNSCDKLAKFLLEPPGPTTQISGCF